jgi:hypothetical protein
LEVVGSLVREADTAWRRSGGMYEALSPGLGRSLGGLSRGGAVTEDCSACRDASWTSARRSG